MELREKYEARRCERKLIRQLKPNLNATERPFWLLKNQYVAVYKMTVRRRGRNRGMRPRDDAVVPL